MQPDRAGLSSTADAGNPSNDEGPKRYGSRHCAVFDVARRPKGRARRVAQQGNCADTLVGLNPKKQENQLSDL